MMVRVLISIVLGSFYFTLCSSGGLSHIFKGKEWLRDIELIAKPIVFQANKMPMMEMNSANEGKKLDPYKLLAIKSLIHGSIPKGENGGGEKSQAKGWEAEDIKAWKTPKMEEKEKIPEEEIWKPAPPEKPEEKWVLVQVKKSKMEPPKMRMKPESGWAPEAKGWEPEMMMMAKSKGNGWEPPMEEPKMMMKPGGNGWETPMQPPKMTMMMKPENKGWELPKKGWEPPMEPPKMMMKPEENGWEPPSGQEPWKQIEIKAWESPEQPQPMKEEMPMEPPKMMMNGKGKSWEPPTEEGKGWELPTEEGKGWELPTEEGKGWKPPTEEGKGWKPQTEEGKGWEPPTEEGKGWEPPTEEGKGWKPPTEEPKMMMMVPPESNGWEPPKKMMMEPPMEPPKQPEKWVLVQVKGSKPEPPKEREAKEENDPWKAIEAAAAFWESAGKQNGGGQAMEEGPWKAADSQNRPFILGYGEGVKEAIKESESQYKPVMQRSLDHFSAFGEHINPLY